MLVEVHDGEELKRALALDAKLIGVNNRDLRTFEVDLARTEEIAAIFPFDEERVLLVKVELWDKKMQCAFRVLGQKQFLLVNHLCEVEQSKKRFNPCKLLRLGIGK